MKHLFIPTIAIQIAAAILVSAFLGACAPDPDMAQEAGSIRVLAPRNDAEGKYSLEVSELLGIEDIRTMTGKFVRFFLGPAVVKDHLEGVSPRTRFLRNADGDYIPSDEMTQQLVTIYLHMQKFAALDEELGAGGVNHWPRDVGIAVRIRGEMTNNAFYEGKTDSMLFVPYTQTGLPIPINGGILAHEHFHSLFYKLAIGDATAQVHNREDFLNHAGISDDEKYPGPNPFFSTSPEDSTMRNYFQAAMIRGMNEGLADFWGWMYTGDPDFIVQSIPLVKSTRSLKVRDENSVNSLPAEELILRDLRNSLRDLDQNSVNDFITGYAYSLGTQFSRVMKRYSDIYARTRGVDSLQARKEVAKIIVKMLPSIHQSVAALNGKYQDTKSLKDTSYTSVQFLEGFIASAGELRQEECEFLASLANNSKNSDVNTSYSCKEQNSLWSVTTESVLVEDPHTTPESASK